MSEIKTFPVIEELKNIEFNSKVKRKNKIAMRMPLENCTCIWTILNQLHSCFETCNKFSMSARDKSIFTGWEILTPYELYLNLYELDIVVDMSETWNLAGN